MGQIGSFKYPQHTIEECAKIVKTIYDRNISNLEPLADELDHSSIDSGTFRNKLTSLRRYGLTSGRGEIKLTELGERVAKPAPNSNEREEALAEAVLNVSLLSRLYDQVGFEQPGDDFWYDLLEVTDVNRSVAEKQAPRIKRLFEAGLPYVRRTQEPKPKETSVTEKSSSVEIKEVNRPSMAEDVDATVVTKEFGEIKIKNQATLDIARRLLDLLENSYDQDNGSDETILVDE